MNSRSGCKPSLRHPGWSRFRRGVELCPKEGNMRRALLAFLLTPAMATLYGATAYDFSGTYVAIPSGLRTGPVHFSLTVPNPVTTDKVFFPAGALSCDACDR